MSEERKPGWVRLLGQQARGAETHESQGPLARQRATNGPAPPSPGPRPPLGCSPCSASLENPGTLAVLTVGTQ